MPDTPERSLPPSTRKLLKDVQAYIKAKDRLLVAHRTGSNSIACSAIDKLQKLADVPERIEEALR
jgi:hypothetical protein